MAELLLPRATGSPRQSPSKLAAEMRWRHPPALLDVRKLHRYYRPGISPTRSIIMHIGPCRLWHSQRRVQPSRPCEQQEGVLRLVMLEQEQGCIAACRRIAAAVYPCGKN